MGIVGLVPAPCIGLLISSVAVLGWILIYAGGSALGMITSDLGGALQFVWLLGIEFGLYAIALAMIVYVVARFRGRRGAAVRG